MDEKWVTISIKMALTLYALQGSQLFLISFELNIVSWCYASCLILSSRTSLMLLTYHICMTGPSLPSTGLTLDFATI
jgi:hypothetical protein